MDSEKNGQPGADAAGRVPVRDVLPLSWDICRPYQGQWIVFSEAQGRVIGAAETLEEASEQARSSGVGGEWHYRYVDHEDDLLV
jgi:hypothetical protein